MGALTPSARAHTAAVHQAAEQAEFNAMLIAAFNDPDVQAAFAKALSRHLTRQPAPSRPPVSARELKHGR